MRFYSSYEIRESVAQQGPVLAGLLFGWCLWADAAMCTSQPLPGVYHIPGVGATLAIVLVNCVRREDVSGGYDADGTLGQKRAWLFVSYLCCFGALGGAIAALLTYFVNPPHDQWVGAALIIQCVAIIAGGLLYWMSRSAELAGGF